MRRLTFHQWSVLAAIVLGAVLITHPSVVVRAQNANNPPVILVPGEANGILLAPGMSATLPVVVSDAAGNPLAGAAVLFVAPADGASGALANAGPADPTVLRVVTGDDGSASAIFTAGPTGVFLVDAIVENQDAGVTFAVTVTGDPAPAVPPDQARQAILQQLFPGAQEGPAMQLYGPVYLPAGTTVASDGASTDLYPTTPSTVSAPAWFFWSDSLPGAYYAHDTQFITLDATDPAASPVVTHEGWWPNLTLPGAAAVALRPVSSTRTTVPAPAGSAVFTRPRSVVFLPAADVAPEDTCVIAIYGPGSSAASNDQDAMKDLALNTFHVPAGNVFTGTTLLTTSRPASVHMFESFVTQAKQKGCKKLIVSISGHGGGGQVQLADDANSGQEESLDFTLLGEILSTFAGTGTEVDVVITSCYSGAAIAAMQNHGFSGTVVTSADRANSSWATYFTFGRPSSFLGALRDCWKDPANSSTPGQLPSLADAFACVKKNGGYFANYGNPQISAIMPNGLPYATPNVSIPFPKGTATLNITAPPGATGKTRVSVSIANAGIATFSDGTTEMAKVLTPGQTATLTLIGVSPGTTGYTIMAVDSNDFPFNGAASITVGNPYSLNTPLNLKVGDKQVVTVTRAAGAATAAATMTITPVGDGPKVATADATQISFQPGETTKTFNVQAVSAGTATYTLVDTATKASVNLVINVTQATQTSCPINSKLNLQFAVAQDPGDSARFVGLVNGVLTMMRSGTQVMVTGDRAQLVPATGVFNATACSFQISGISTGPVAGVSNVHATYNVSIDVVKNAVTGQYSVGTQKDFFGEPPVVYNVTGTSAPF